MGRISLQSLLVGGLIAAAVAAPLVTGNQHWSYVFSLIAVYFIAGNGLSLIVGAAREVSIGHSAFFAVGAYSFSVTQNFLGLGSWVGLLLAVFLGAAVGVGFGLLTHRISGPRFTLATLCLAVIAEHLCVELKSVTGGFGGVYVSRASALPAFGQSGTGLYLLVMIVAVLVYWGLDHFRASNWGRTFYALGDDSLALESLGRGRLAVFPVALGLSGAVTALGGWLFAPVAQHISPDSFPSHFGIDLLVICILGGGHSSKGPLLGALLVLGGSEALAGLPHYKLLLYGVLLLVAVYVVPEGLASLFEGGRRDEPPVKDLGPALKPVRGRGGVELERVEVHFGGVTALDRVSASFPDELISFVIGANGAGKTTMLNVITGNCPPGGGSVKINGEVVKRLTRVRACSLGIGRTFQQPRFFPSLSLRENLLVGVMDLNPKSFLLGFLSPEQRAFDAGAAFSLLKRLGSSLSLDGSVSALPFGSLRSLELARVLAQKPSILLLDEPSSGLDEGEIKQLVENVRYCRAQGITVIVVSHEARLISALADHVLVLDEGRVQEYGSPTDITLSNYVYVEQPH